MGSSSTVRASGRSGWSVTFPGSWFARSGERENEQAAGDKRGTHPRQRRQAFAHHQHRQDGGHHCFGEGKGGGGAGTDTGQSPAKENITREHRDQGHVSADGQVLP